MSGTGRAATAETADSDAADRLRTAPFVRLVAHADGDCLAAAGLLLGALDDAGVPFRARLVRTATAARRAVRGGGDDAVDLAVGVPAPDGGVAVGAGDRPASERAYDLAAAVGGDPDPVVALAGVAAAGEPTTAAQVPHAAAEERGRVERRPGVAAPVPDAADGLAHTTLAHCGFSGDSEAAAAALAEVVPDEGAAPRGGGDTGSEPETAGADASDRPDDEDPDGRDVHETVASLVALSAARGDAPPRAATAVERALRPLATPEGPFATVGGHADVLGALARDRPGLGLAVAFGADRTDPALAAWRDHARAAHGAVADAEVGVADDVAVADVGDVGEAPLWTVARLLRDFRVEAPVAAAVGDGAVAVAGTAGADVAGAVRAAADEVAADAATVGRRGYARTDDAGAFLDALRGAV